MHIASLVSLKAYSIITAISSTHKKCEKKQVRNGELTPYHSFLIEDNPVLFLLTQLGKSSNDTLSTLVLRVFRFNWIKYCLFDISSSTLI